MIDANGVIIKLGDYILGKAGILKPRYGGWRVYKIEGELYWIENYFTSTHHITKDYKEYVKIMDNRAILQYKLGKEFTKEDWDRL